jgi:hypothetical protein
MYRVYLSNFGYWLECHFETLTQALVAAKRTGFQCTIIDSNSDVVAAWCPLIGTTRYRD